MDSHFEKYQGDQGESLFSKILFYSFAGRYSAMLLLVVYCLLQNNWIIRSIALVFIPLIFYGLKTEYGIWVNEWRQVPALPKLVTVGSFMAIPVVFLLSNLFGGIGQTARFTVTILAALISIVPAYFL